MAACSPPLAAYRDGWAVTAPVSKSDGNPNSSSQHPHAYSVLPSFALASPQGGYLWAALTQESGLDHRLGRDADTPSLSSLCLDYRVKMGSLLKVEEKTEKQPRILPL